MSVYLDTLASLHAAERARAHPVKGSQHSCIGAGVRPHFSISPALLAVPAPEHCGTSGEILPDKLRGVKKMPHAPTAKYDS